MRRIYLWSLVLLCVVGRQALAGASDRGVIVSRMVEFLDITLQTNTQLDHDCLVRNLDRSEFDCTQCSGHEGYPDPQPHRSDILWHPDFLNGAITDWGWWGMNYSYGGHDNPDELADIQQRLDECYGIGNHLCHYNCGSPTSWSVGADCSSGVCYAGDVSRTNTAGLDNDNYGVLIPWTSVQEGSYLVRSDHHVVLVETRSGDNITIIELTGDYPVARRADRTISSYQGVINPPYHPRDFKDVANDQGGSGVLLAMRSGAVVNLSWIVKSAAHTRWYEFQYYDEMSEMWVTIDGPVMFRGAGKYECHYEPPGHLPRDLVFRVWEVETTGRGIPHGETFASEGGVQ